MCCSRGMVISCFIFKFINTFPQVWSSDFNQYKEYGLPSQFRVYENKSKVFFHHLRDLDLLWPISILLSDNPADNHREIRSLIEDNLIRCQIHMTGSPINNDSDPLWAVMNPGQKPRISQAGRLYSVEGPARLPDWWTAHNMRAMSQKGFSIDEDAGVIYIGDLKPILQCHIYTNSYTLAPFWGLLDVDHHPCYAAKVMFGFTNDSLEELSRIMSKCSEGKASASGCWSICPDQAMTDEEGSEIEEVDADEVVSTIL